MKRITAGLLPLLTLLLAGSALAGPLETARRLSEERRWREAADAWAKALAAAPGNREATLGLADAVVRGKRSDLLADAQDALYVHMKRNEEDWPVRTALGWVCLDLEQTKSQDNARKFLNTEAETHFRAVLEAQPQDGSAAAGLARTLYERGYLQDAADSVDEWLSKNPPDPAHALFWKGQALYLLARDAFAAAGGQYPLGAEAKALFEKARGAYQGSAAGDPTRFETWLQLAYTSQYLGDVAGAREAYLTALPLDLTSGLPVRGLQSLLAHDPAAWQKTLEELVAKHADHAELQMQVGWQHLQASKHPEAVRAFEAYLRCGGNAALAHELIGRAQYGQGDRDAALRSFRKALELESGRTLSAEYWEDILRSRYQPDPITVAASSVKNAKQMIEDYKPIFAAATSAPSVRNNLAFTLREAYGRHAGDKEWLPVLKECARIYEDGSELLGEWDPMKARSWTWAQRWAAAQLLNDTGLMFWFYAEIRDVKKAEDYYDRAVEFTENGYKDTLGNLERLYTEAGRWEDLYDLALAYAEGARREDGTPDMNVRGYAAGVAKRLEQQGKVEPR